MISMIVSRVEDYFQYQLWLPYFQAPNIQLIKTKSLVLHNILVVNHKHDIVYTQKILCLQCHASMHLWPNNNIPSLQD
jgi:hypothetical protein